MIWRVFKEIYNGKTLVRALMHLYLKDMSISGITLDIGGGRAPEYWDILKKDTETKIISIDFKQIVKNKKIDLEKDTLPYSDLQIDTILMFNILEHIYNHKHLTKEAVRVLKKDGIIIGFVPFLVNYHPDPHDYFRYTKESLRRIFEEVGGRGISIVSIGRGPFAVNYNNIMLAVPIIIRIFIFPAYYLLDSVYLWLRPNITERFPLGYMFSFKK